MRLRIQPMNSLIPPDVKLKLYGGSNTNTKTHLTLQKDSDKYQ